MLKKRLLLIEDDQDLGASLSENLQLEGYYVDWSRDGVEGLKVAQKQTHDLILLDLMLPNKGGYEILEEIRQTSTCPIFILSAKSQSEDKIKGLELRADDYLTKPFQLKELFLRIENLFRRQQTKAVKQDKIQIGPSKIDLSTMMLKNESFAEQLSETEIKTLLLFYNNVNQYLSRDEIIDHVWGYNKHPNVRTVDNIVLKFRKMMEPTPSEPIYFVSKRGMGYSLQLNKEET